MYKFLGENCLSSTKFKQSDKIYRYINDYCLLNQVLRNTTLSLRIRAIPASKIKVKNYIKSCLNDKFNIKNVDCNTKGTFTNGQWDYQFVWLE